ncbi:hypothetical protein HYH02_012225 [Chlamydomonas schloesseri]|uniref:Uncharacterized protein n=1 Tax=Chlamydomonas schloesseri TaxID=2026947 RepID=A0A835SWL8_9CHLO|nr:hypothetical protein HYH02_012225 [Chlamydomonas schloesseri]|eukprot:KAG2434559.1 hypothetical protein HYH02_012225 [Chlamydomonas schloesseri]
MPPRGSACRGSLLPGVSPSAGTSTIHSGRRRSSSSCHHRLSTVAAAAASRDGASAGTAPASTSTSTGGWDPAAPPPPSPTSSAALLGDWSEHAVWQAAIEGAVGSGDPAAAAALLRSLAGLRLLLPDLEPHWAEQLSVQQKLVAIEHMLTGTAASASASSSSPSSPSTSASTASTASSQGQGPQWDVCLYGEAQRAAGELRGLAPFFRQYGTRATESCFQHSSWVLGEALMGAARNYSGPGSTLLRARDLEVAAVAVRGLRRAHEGHLGALVRLQCRLALALPQVGQRLVELRTALSQQQQLGPGAVAVDVGHLAATNLALLLPPAYTGSAVAAAADSSSSSADGGASGGQHLERCSSLTLDFRTSGDEEDAVRHPALLAPWCVAGVGAEVARNITTLRLSIDVDLPTLTTAVLALAGTLRHVRRLELDSCDGAGGFTQFYNMHNSLRNAFPALEELNLPALACLRGLEAFTGSALHTVRVMAGSPGHLRMAHVRSLVQLQQLRHLDLAGAGWDVVWYGHDEAWDEDEDNHEDGGAGDAGELPPGDEGDEETLGELEEEGRNQLWALRRLLASAPPALESLRLPDGLQDVRLSGGRITSVETEVGDGTIAAGNSVAAALLPQLTSMDQRLPLLKIAAMGDRAAEITQLLQPHTPFARLLARTDRVELGELGLSTYGCAQPAAEAAAALQAAVRAARALPSRLRVYGSGWSIGLQVASRRAGSEAGSSSSSSALQISAAAPHGCPGQQALPPVAEATAVHVLAAATGRAWEAAVAAEGLAAQAEAAMARYARAVAPHQEVPWHLSGLLQPLDVLLRGPLVWQLTCGPAGGGGGAGGGSGGGGQQHLHLLLLREWLVRLIQQEPQPARLPSWLRPGAAAAGLAHCSLAPCGGPGSPSHSSSAVVRVSCTDAIAALQLYRAAVKVAGQTPGLLLVAATRTSAEPWSRDVEQVIRKLWDGHLASASAAAAASEESSGGGASRPAKDNKAGGAGRAGGRQAAAHDRDAQQHQLSAAAGQQQAGTGGAAAASVAADGSSSSSGLECDLAALQHLLLLAEQANKAIVDIELA